VAVPDRLAAQMEPSGPRVMVNPKPTLVTASVERSITAPLVQM
jgi:hypothetical protein